MSQSYKLSLPLAIVINMNIMLGVGLFVNTISLSKLAGIASPAVYLLVAVLMLPLVLSISKLLKTHPGGSFYTFGSQEISPRFGFLTSWSYFVSKMASATLMIHFAMLILQKTFPAISSLPIMGLDLAVLGAFTALNLQNMRTSSRIQFLFMTLKVLPVLFVVISGLIFFDMVQINTSVVWESIPLSIPLIIYAFSGFEASCSLSAHIQNAGKNAPRATLTAYFVIAGLSALYQLMFYALMSNHLDSLTHYFEIFPTVVKQVFGSASFGPHLQAALQMAIAVSSLGGSYGIMFSNCWNLQILAKHNHLPGSTWIGKLNEHAIPTACILAELLIGVLYLLATWGNNIPLQQISAFGCTLAYAMCVIALLANAKRQNSRSALILPVLGIVSCMLLLASCINGFLKNGTYSPLAIFGLIALGVVLFRNQNK